MPRSAQAATSSRPSPTNLNNLASAIGDVRGKKDLRSFIAIGGLVFLLILEARGQTLLNSGRSPQDVVNLLWTMATQGELLTPEKWNHTSALFTHPIQPRTNDAFLVVSNYWGPASQTSIMGDTAGVVMGFIDQGTVNSSLRYSPPEPTDAIKTGKLYNLSRVTTRMPIYGSDGKSVIEIKPGPIEWQLEGNQGQRWTTVNTAIRYIIEMRNIK
jgi:hypothetical protein